MIKGVRKLIARLPGRNRYAIALSYDLSRPEVPKVMASGMRARASDIIRLGYKWGIPIIERGALAAALAQIDEGLEISEELFEAVAMVVAEVERQKQRQMV